MGKRLLIFGGTGFVGGTVAKLSSQAFETAVVATSQKSGFEDLAFHQADITEPEQVRAVFERFKPQIVVNAAALSDIEKAEACRELAYAINVEGARHIATAAAAHSCRCLHLSSDAIFDGQSASYREDDAPAPVNYYGTTKMQAEKAVLEGNPNSLIVRISLVLGFPVNGGNSYLANLEKSLSAGKTVECPVEEVRTPIDVLTLSESILELARSEHRGVIHVASTDSIDRYQLALKAARAMDFAGSLIKPKTAGTGASQPARAPRHKNGILDVAKARGLLTIPMPGIDQTIARALESDGFFRKDLNA